MVNYYMRSFTSARKHEYAKYSWNHGVHGASYKFTAEQAHGRVMITLAATHLSQSTTPDVSGNALSCAGAGAAGAPSRCTTSGLLTNKQIHYFTPASQQHSTLLPAAC